MLKRQNFILTAFLLSLGTAHSAFAETFEVPRSFEIMYLDQQVASKFGNDFKIDVDPGQHQIVFRFNKIIRSGGDSEVYQSEPIVLDLNVPSGAYLQLQAPYISSHRQAQDYAKQPNFSIRDEASGRDVSYQQRMLAKQSGLQNLRDYLGEVKALDEVKSLSQDAPLDPPVKMNSAPALSMLKFWYNQADIDTRKAMRVWIADAQQQAKQDSIQLEMLQFWFNKADDKAKTSFQMWLIGSRS
ncbi:DUF2057 domain-containing protein [Marinomonas sp. THO17]|uniref:YccT family protein n=1 Tax=Marinomonas sp. THO17 TaxID=3149048 RepID=UPI00336C2969